MGEPLRIYSPSDCLRWRKSKQSLVTCGRNAHFVDSIETEYVASLTGADMHPERSRFI